MQDTTFVDLPTLQEEISSRTGMFGFEEKLLKGTIDTTNIWTEVTGGTGASSVVGSAISLSTGATSGSIISLESKQLFGGKNSILGNPKFSFEKMIIEWVFKLGGLASYLDNAAVFMGAAQNTGGSRASDYINGFIFEGDVLYALTRTTTEEKTDVSAGITLTEENKYRIEGSNSEVKFYINEVLVATHASAGTNLYRLLFYNKNDSANIAALNLWNIRAWFE